MGENSRKNSQNSHSNCESDDPLQHSKTPQTPKFVQNLFRQLFLRVPIRGAGICQKFVQICPNIMVFIFSNLSTHFAQIPAPLTGTLKNNRRDKFWTNLGFGAFLSAVRGRRARNTQRLFFWDVSAVCRLFCGCFPGTLPGPNRQLFQLFFVGGRRDRNIETNITLNYVQIVSTVCPNSSRKSFENSGSLYLHLL